jgi:hypothetical protein
MAMVALLQIITLTSFDSIEADITYRESPLPLGWQTR